MESYFNLLTNFLDGNLEGNRFDRSIQLEAYQKIIFNNQYLQIKKLLLVIPKIHILNFTYTKNIK